MSASVIFQGVKFFWRTRNTIDIMLVEHADHFTTEIVAYDPTIDREAPRIYVDSNLLFSKLNYDDIAAQLSFGQRNGVLISEETIVGKAKFDFILSRLLISEYAVATRTIKMAFQPGTDEVLMCGPKPQELVPFHSPHYHTLMEGVVEQAMSDLLHETIGLKKVTETARVLEEGVRKALNTRERWRIPMVFIKVSKNHRLSPSDTRIWQKVTANMKTEEDAARMAAALSPKPLVTVDSPTGATATTEAVTYVALPVAYAVPVVPAIKVSKTAASPRHAPPMQRTPSHMSRQRSQRLPASEEDAPAPLKASPSNARLLNRGNSVRGNSVRCSPSSPTDHSANASTPKVRTSGQSHRIAASGAAAEREATVRYGAPPKYTKDAPEADMSSTLQGVINAVAGSLRSSFGLTANKRSSVQPVDGSGATGDDKSAPRVYTSTKAACVNELDVTPRDDQLTPKPAAAPTPKKKSSFLLSLLQSLSLNTHSPPHSFSSPVDAPAGQSSAAPAPVSQSRFPLVQMVFAGLRGRNSGSASEKSA